MVAPPQHQPQTPLQQHGSGNNSNATRQTGAGSRWYGGSENERPANWAENRAAATAPRAEAGDAAAAGAGSVLGVLSSTSPRRGPEVDDDYSPRGTPGGFPLTDRQRHQAAMAAPADVMHETLAWGQQYVEGGVLRGESKEHAGSTQDVELEMWKLGLQVGSRLDVKDTVDKWCEAKITRVDREAGKVLITYIYWSPKWDEWISIDSPRLAPKGTMTYQEGGPLRVGHRVDVFDEAHQWLEADVIDTSEDGRGLVHFKGFSKKFDMWVSPRGGRVRHFGRHRMAPRGINRSSARQASLAPGQQHVRQIAQLSSRYEHYQTALRNQGLCVIPVEGDGNCLFRSVSHQVYGDDSYHGLVRARCMDYMESEANFFEPFVEGDRAAFLRYLDVKRQNAVWGDDPEVQALCEIYDRPAEIWAYDSQLGAKPLRTFHEAAGSGTGSPRPPMRLSYYGGGHYDSLALLDSPVPAGVLMSPASAAPASGDVMPGMVAGNSGGGVLPVPQPGQLEEAALERSRRRAAEAGGGRWDPEEIKVEKDDEDTPAARAVLDQALAYSRNVFEAQFDDLDSALVASVDHMEQSNLSSLEAASRDSELVVLQDEMLRSAQAQSEEEQLRNAIEASRNSAAAAAAEEHLLRQAIAESMGTGGANTSTVDATSSASGAPAQGGGDVGGAAVGFPTESQGLGGYAATAAGSSGVGDEDEELRRALLMSGMTAGGEWETPPAEAGVPGKEYDADGLDDDAQLRLAIEASLAGD